ncbi:hypothetical protein GGI03_008139, partial [Coemansia sp. RSA 2337]
GYSLPEIYTASRKYCRCLIRTWCSGRLCCSSASSRFSRIWESVSQPSKGFPKTLLRRSSQISDAWMQRWVVDSGA